MLSFTLLTLIPEERVKEVAKDGSRCSSLASIRERTDAAQKRIEMERRSTALLQTVEEGRVFVRKGRE